jgi:hypothetical protein
MNTRSKIREIFTLAAGLLAAVVIVLMQVCVFETEQKEASPSTENTPQEQVMLSATHDALLQVSALELHHHFYFIAEIVLDDTTRSELVERLTQPVVTYLQVLFRRIISPNAP